MNPFEKLFLLYVLQVVLFTAAGYFLGRSHGARREARTLEAIYKIHKAQLNELQEDLSLLRSFE